MRRLILSALVAATTLCSPVLAQTSSAVAELEPTGSHQASGTVYFAQEGDKIRVIANLKGLTPNGEHGFHIHQYGDETAADGTSAGDHFNPGGDVHAGPQDADRHAGDLGNVKADGEGNASLDITVMGRTDSIVGRSVVLHARADDLQSQPSGNSGVRIAIGVIGIANPKTMPAMEGRKLYLRYPNRIMPSNRPLGVPWVDIQEDSPRVEDPHADKNLQNQPIDGTLDRKVGPNDDIRDLPSEK